MAVNASFVSPTADAKVAHVLEQFDTNGLLSTLFTGFGFWKLVLTVIVTAVAYDQFKYIWNKGSIVGPSWKIPFIGPFLESVNPDFNKYHEKWASGPLSCVSVFHKFVVIASTRDMARKIFNSPAFVKPCVVDVAYKLLRPENWVFLDGRAHVDYRKGLNGLFTRQALEQYLPGQEDIYNSYFKRFVQLSQGEHKGKHVPWMQQFRLMITALSCRTFVGHYCSDEAVKKIADDYYLITAALELVNFPVIIPFTKTWYGKKCADMVLEEFSKCAAKSKVRMAAGGKKECILDFWVDNMIESEKYRKRVEAGEKVDDSEKPATVIRWFSDLEISMTIFTFLFASQDATSSAATWLFQIMADRPEYLEKIREENIKARNGDVHASISLDTIEKLQWTRAVVKETLRYRPPVIMVPYLAKKDFPISPEYTVPKGSMVIPTTYMALHDAEAYPNPDSFEPERWITGDAEQQTKNWLVFGTGPHYCLGQTYAQANLMLMIGKASMLLDWDHQVTDQSEVIKVFATIFPMSYNAFQSIIASSHPLTTRFMAPTASPSERDAERVGPHPSYIEIAKPYILQSRMQRCLSEINMTDAKEDSVRLQGVAWIDQVRRALQLPIRTFNTAVIYYHKFRLLHADNEYNWADAAAAALFTACKIEDTLKKSREILCAHWNLKVGPGESLSSDDPRFENHSKLIIGLERLMLESAGFDFRNRYPQKLMIKLARALRFDASNEAKTTWNLSIDSYRTFAPLKQSTPTLAIACIELAARLHAKDATRFVDTGPVRYSKWATSRAEVMETLLDLLDLYTHHRSVTSVGPLYTLEHFINIRIGLNQEASAANIPRYSQYGFETALNGDSITNGAKPRNGIDPTSPLTPTTPLTLSPGMDQPPKSAIGIRGQNGTVRFMLDAARAHDERAAVEKFHKAEEEEYEVEVPYDTRVDDRDRERARAGRDSIRGHGGSRDIMVPASNSHIKIADTEQTGKYWIKFSQGSKPALQCQHSTKADNLAPLSRQAAKLDTDRYPESEGHEKSGRKRPSKKDRDREKKKLENIDHEGNPQQATTRDHAERMVPVTPTKKRKLHQETRSHPQSKTGLSEQDGHRWKKEREDNNRGEFRGWGSERGR
ncbi:cytochrome p450 61 [Pyrenophora seminiperda CCB06]|uniref:sterol 22-desaturase n=1 Tax=Pyrenophora seminiperda CCB06 TaxID=1302712 RepID=A0A3M7MBN2_9PLEO|nr:cytochrome p450 61 [Pyrenophora seminiperda CCB06]